MKIQAVALENEMTVARALSETTQNTQLIPLKAGQAELFPEA